jgi:hypothetical protein
MEDAETQRVDGRSRGLLTRCVEWLFRRNSQLPELCQAAEDPSYTLGLKRLTQARKSKAIPCPGSIVWQRRLANVQHDHEHRQESEKQLQKCVDLVLEAFAKGTYTEAPASRGLAIRVYITEELPYDTKDAFKREIADIVFKHGCCLLLLSGMTYLTAKLEN